MSDRRPMDKLLLFGTFLLFVGTSDQSGVTYYIYKYILISDVPMSWTDAESFCRAEYGDLATIYGAHANSQIASLAGAARRPVWIGLYADVEGWEWSLEADRFYTGLMGRGFRRWREGQPDNAESDEHCVSIMQDGFWRDNSCTDVQMPLICFTDDDEEPYVLVTLEKDWFEARNYCRQHHTDLVSVRSPAENQDLSSRLQRGNGSVQEAWIGLHRGAWKWSDGSRSPFRMWWPREPDNKNNSEACAAMMGGRWMDQNCSAGLSVLCQNVTEVTPSAEPDTIDQETAQRRTTAVAMKLLTGAPLTQPSFRDQVLQQLEAALRLQGLTDVTLHWRTLRTASRDDV